MSTREALARELSDLRTSWGCVGVKAEFEAEGSSFRDVVLLRSLTLQADLQLHIKVGGCEAIRDIHDCVELGVEGIIAPMVESPFAAEKFLIAVDQVGVPPTTRLAINVESVSAVHNLSEILTVVRDRVANITIGRSDLSQSMNLGNKTQDSPELLNVVWDAIATCVSLGIPVVVGGGMTARSLELLRADPRGLNIMRVETRKVMFDVASLLDPRDAFGAALSFESDLILFRRALSENRMRVDLDRVTELKSRAM